MSARQNNFTIIKSIKKQIKILWEKYNTFRYYWKRWLKSKQDKYHNKTLFKSIIIIL